MRRDLYCVTCFVDNGASTDHYKSYVFAFSENQAKEIVLRFWNAQYDTFAKVKAVNMISCTSNEIICTEWTKG